MSVLAARPLRSAATTALVLLVVVAAFAVPVHASVVVPAQDAEGAATGQIVDFDILPDVLTVESGTTITWTNDGGRPHTVTDRGGMFDTGPVLPGASASLTVDVPGTYEVFCRINPSRMNATIVVEPGDDPPPAVRVQAFDEAREGERERFDPAELEVDAGTELILANVGGEPHSLRAEDTSFRVPVVEPGAEAGRFAGGNGRVVLTDPGTFAFFCEIHPDTMRGTIVVREVEGAPVPAPPDPGGGGDAEPPERPPPESDATMEDFSFSPSELEAEPGAEVTWTNAGDTPHTATFDDIDLDTGLVDPGDTATVAAPEEPGTYSYFCAVHPQMRGALLVRRADVVVAPPPARADPPDGTVLAYALAAVFVATGVVGLVLALRRRPPAPAAPAAPEVVTF